MRELHDRTAQLQARIDSVTSQGHERERDLAAFKRHNNEQVDEFMAMNSRLREDLQLLATENEQLQEQLRHLHSENNRLRIKEQTFQHRERGVKQREDSVRRKELRRSETLTLVQEQHQQLVAAQESMQLKSLELQEQAIKQRDLLLQDFKKALSLYELLAQLKSKTSIEPVNVRELIMLCQNHKLTQSKLKNNITTLEQKQKSAKTNLAIRRLGSIN
ncbi:MAG: hypothetical protein ACPGUD_10065 [Parashewanella sp.]